ncbi:hypothetical protein BC827DRAFT_1250682 [Russula dissimulans]|nr:hypothetical protein BC827DRAFT_1250682 [Russula dissimulans]
MSRGPTTIDIGPNAAEDVWINSVVHVSATVILYYDYMLTLDRKIRFLWPPHNKQEWFTAAFLLNRYISIFGYLPFVVSYFITLDFPFCVGVHRYYEWFIMVVQFYAGFLCSFRVYALYGQSRRVLLFLASIGLLSLVAAAGAIVASRRTGDDAIPVLSSFVGCSQFMPSKKGKSSSVAWAGLSAFDSVIFSLTLYKAFTAGKGIRLLNVIVRDGTIYFLYEPLSLFIDENPTIPNSVLFIMNVSNIFNLLFSPPFLRTSTTTITNVFVSTLTLVSTQY